MTEIKNNRELGEQFRHLMWQGEEVIPSHLEFEWKNYIEKWGVLGEQDRLDFLSKCQTIVKYLLKFRNNTSGRDVASEFYQEYPYKSAYTKDIADVITRFAPFPENVQFLQGFYESFLDITKEEDKKITYKISQIRAINDIMNLGIDYNNARFINNASFINIDFNGEIIPAMLWTNDIYCGISEKNELLTYRQIGEDFDVLYIDNADNSYTRLINRRAKLTPNGMLSEKNLMTNPQGEKIADGNNSLSVNANFFDINQKVALYQKLCNRLAEMDPDVGREITQEAIKLSDTIDEKNNILCATIFNELLSSDKTSKNPTK